MMGCKRQAFMEPLTGGLCTFMKAAIAAIGNIGWFDSPTPCG